MRPQSAASLLEAFDLYGGAVPLGDGGELRLTGQLRTEAGSAVLRANSTQPLFEFNLSCMLSFGETGPRDGFGLSYGANLSSLRQFGGGAGLRVTLLPHSGVIQAWFGHELLAETTAGPDGSRRRSVYRPARGWLALDVPALFSAEVRCVAACSSGGAGGVNATLRVTYGGKVLIDATLVGWTKVVRTGWRFGLGAGTAHESVAGRAADRKHTISEFRLRAGASLSFAETAFGVSYNGVDFFPDPDGPSPAPFGYGVPQLLSVTPRVSTAGTALKLRGNFLPTTRLDVVQDYRCQWTELVTTTRSSDADWEATFDFSRAVGGWSRREGGTVSVPASGEIESDGLGEYLRCETPNLAFGRYALDVSLQSSPFGDDGVHVVVVMPAEPLSAVPDDGPATGPASVLVTGLQLSAGFEYACSVRPGYTSVDGAPVGLLPATYVAAARAVRCVLPQPNSTDLRELDILPSLDGEEFNVGKASFTFRAPPTAATLLPAAAPNNGGTLVNVTGTRLGADGGAAVECRFGSSPATATRWDAGKAMCFAPASEWAGLLLGAPVGQVIPDLSAEWLDGSSPRRAMQVCTRDGLLALSVEGVRGSATGTWDVQRGGYVGLWQQWRSQSTDQKMFADGGSSLHSAGERARAGE